MGAGAPAAVTEFTHGREKIHAESDRIDAIGTLTGRVPPSRTCGRNPRLNRRLSPTSTRRDDASVPPGGVTGNRPDAAGNGHGGTPGNGRLPRRPDDTERNELRLNATDFDGPDDTGDEGPTLLDAASVEAVLTTFPRESRAPAAEVPTPRRSSEDWATLYRFAVLGLDFLAAVIAGIAAVYLRFYVFDRDVSELPTISGFTYWQFAAIFPVAWIFSMA